MKLHNIVKKMLLIAVAGVLAISMYPQSISVEATTDKKDTSYSESTTELIKKFPNFKKSIDKDTTGKLESSTELYVKLQKKENVQAADVYTSDTLEKDFNVSYYTIEEFKKQSVQAVNLYDSNTVTANSIGNLETPYCSWLRLDLQVYYGTGLTDYMAYNFCSWLTRPLFTLTDGIGISMSTGLICSEDASTRHAEYTSGTSWENEAYFNLPISMGTNGNGVLATHKLTSNNAGLYNNWMISTGVSYNNSGIFSGWITAHYVHKEVSVGGISLDAAGMPSIGLSLADASISGQRHVSR